MNTLNHDMTPPKVIRKELEKDVELYLKKQIEKRGGKCYKWSSPQLTGVMDRIAIIPGYLPMFIEVKRTKGKLTPRQIRVADEMKSRGAIVYTVYGKVGVDEFLGWIDKGENMHAIHA